MKWPRMSFGFFIIVLIVGWFYMLISGRGDSSAVQVGSVVPIFSVSDEAGREVTHEALRGRFVLVHFWATWCGPCKAELPALERFLQKMKTASETKDKVTALLVSEDLGGKSDTDPFRARFGILWPFHFDPSGTAAAAFGTDRIPETYLINPEGVLVKKWSGEVLWDDASVWRELVSRLL